MRDQTPSSDTCTFSNTERLKAEGNALHQSGQYQGAYNKYSEAIKEDTKSAVLWANRAASALAMKKYLDASSDAQKATTLDPTYAKAWGRQGTAYRALGTYSKSVEAFKKALGCLPSSGELTKQEQLLKNQFEEGLRKSQDAINRPPYEPMVVVAGSTAKDNLPWKKAMAIEDEMATQRKMSSAFVIAHAYRDFQRGIDDMNTLTVRIVNGQRGLVGTTGVITALTNAILRDKRVFHISQGDFTEKYNNQIQLEVSRCNAWTEGGPKLIQEEAPKRLKTLGWDAVRPALAITVRAWIMRGFLQASFELPGAPAEFIRQALDVLQWGARLWKDVHRDDRGTIFDATFIRGVKRLYLDILMETYNNEHLRQCSLDDIAKLAREIINDSKEMAPPAEQSIDPGFFASFYTYPKADALTILGWYYMRRAFQAAGKEESIEFFVESATHYIQGANLYCKDDEFYTCFLKMGLEAHWYAGSPLKVTLPICKQILEAIPDVQRIWEYSSNADAQKKWMGLVLGFENHFQALVAEGKLTLDDAGAPESVVQRTSGSP